MMHSIADWTRQRRLSLIALGLLLILTFLIAPFSWHLPVLNGIVAEIATDGEHLIIKNGNDFVWENATITINHQYEYRIGLFPRGGTTIPMREFVNREGSAFQSELATLRAVTIRVPNIYDGEEGYFEW